MWVYLLGFSLIILFFAAAALGPGILAAALGIPWQAGLALITIMIGYLLFR